MTVQLPPISGQVRRSKVRPPSVETDAPEILIGLALRPRESLKATTTCIGLSGLAQENVSDCVMLGEVSGWLTKSTSALPNARGPGSRLLTNCEKRPAVEAEPPSASPQKIMIAPARMFSILSM